MCSTYLGEIVVDWMNFVQNTILDKIGNSNDHGVNNHIISCIDNEYLLVAYIPILSRKKINFHQWGDPVQPSYL